MRIQCNVKGRTFEVDFNAAGEPIYVSVWTKGRYGARDATRTLWSSGRKKPMSRLAADGVQAARTIILIRGTAQPSTECTGGKRE